jgi:indole-3-glycerol phosphate synthase
MIFIAEVKTRSPFGWCSPYSWATLFEIANEVGDWVAVHTEAPWGGSLDLLRTARRLTDKPLLAKGLHSSDIEVREAFEAGADHVLVVGRIPSVRPTDCLIEPISIRDLHRIPVGFRAVWNSRDLRTGGRKSELFADARRWSGWLCQASNIEDPRGIDPGADAVLVGTHLPAFADRAR